MQSYFFFDGNSNKNIAKGNGWERQTQSKEIPANIPLDKAIQLQKDLQLPSGWCVSGFFEQENTFYARVEPYNAL